MANHPFDLDVFPPIDGGPFVPDPAFFAALNAVAQELDLEVRYHAAAQVVLALLGAAVMSEGARTSVELATYILTDGLVNSEIRWIPNEDGYLEGIEMGGEDTFGDDGVTASLIFQIVTLPDAVARSSALSVLALQVANEVYGKEPYLATLARYIKRSRKEPLLHLVD